MINKSFIVESLYDALKDSEMIEYYDAKLYLVNRDVLKKILLLASSAKGIETNLKKRDSFFNFGKIINPDKPAIKYSLILQEKYRTVSTREKILKEIKGDFEIAKNFQKMKFEEYIANNPDINADLLSARKKELDEKIENGKSKLNEILENFDRYDVIITNYKNRKYYPFCYYHAQIEIDGKIHKKHTSSLLRKDVPNILWYMPNENIKDKRENKKIDDIVNTYENILDQIYFKEKQENNLTFS